MIKSQDIPGLIKLDPLGVTKAMDTYADNSIHMHRGWRKREAMEKAIRAYLAAAPKSEGAVTAVWKAVVDAQDVLADYIVPDSGISEMECVNRLLGILDHQDLVRAMRAALSNPVPAAREEVGVLIEHVKRYAEDPMWADHAEVPKIILDRIITALSHPQQTEIAAPKMGPFHWKNGIKFAVQERFDGVAVVISQWPGPGVPVDLVLRNELVVPLAEWQSIVGYIEAALASPQGQKSGVTKP